MKESMDMNDAPPSDLESCLYNCSECSSNIEVLALDENKLKFICNNKDNKHNIDIEIKEYLNKMKKFNKIETNDDICNEHKKKYKSYCFDCNIHLCKECLSTREHNYHYIINIKQILPKNKILNKIKNLIEGNTRKINELNKSKKEVENTLNNILNNNIKKIEEVINKNKKTNDQKEKEELTLNNNKYEIEIKKLKEEYENKIRTKKLEYNNNINNIKNKYKIKNEKNENIYNNKINQLKKQIELKIKEYKHDEKIELKTNYNKIIEIIYNTYLKYNNNYYNSLNINNIYDYKKNKKMINNKIIYNKKEIEEKDKIIEESNKKLEEKDKLLKEYNKRINEYIISIRDNNPNSIKIIYNNNKDENYIRIFGYGFVDNNKDKCKI